MALDYDRESRGAGPSVRFHPCAPDTPRFSDDGVVGDETAWAGGFKLQRTGLRDTAPAPRGRGAVAQPARAASGRPLLEDARRQQLEDERVDRDPVVAAERVDPQRVGGLGAAHAQLRAQAGGEDLAVLGA